MTDSNHKFRLVDENKILSDADASLFINSILKPELLKNDNARFVVSKTIRRMLYSFGYDHQWVEGRFRDILEAKLELYREWYPDWYTPASGDGWQTESPDEDVATIIYQKETNDYFWEVVDSEGYSLDEGIERTLEEAKSRALGSLDLTRWRLEHKIKTLKRQQLEIGIELATAKRRLDEDLYGWSDDEND